MFFRLFQLIFSALYFSKQNPFPYNFFTLFGFTLYSKFHFLRLSFSLFYLNYPKEMNGALCLQLYEIMISTH